MTQATQAAGAGALARFGFVAGPLAAVAVFALVPVAPDVAEGVPREAAEGAAATLSAAGRGTMALGAWMAIWWLTEAVDITVTALLPIGLLPLLADRDIDETTAPYAHPLIFLYMGGFVVARAMERWGLHRRIALTVLRRVGSGTRSMVGGFMLVTAALSMWVSNTATVLMMLPIALSVIELLGDRPAEAAGIAADGAPPPQHDNFAICLLLGIAYAASIGGIGTIIGTPPNGFLVDYVEENYGTEIGFARWFAIGLPVIAVMLPLTWLLLCRFVYPPRHARVPGGEELIRSAHAALGQLSRGEALTLVVFLTMAAAWIGRQWLQEIPGLSGLTDPGIGIAAALALFLIPVDVRKHEFVIDWKTASRLPWGTLILFGGGLSLAAAIRDNGVGEFLAGHVEGLRGAPGLVMTLALVTLVIFLTELTSNLATTATLVPILGGLAPGLGVHPFALIVPATIAASCAFMMPVATPPNAVVFSSGHLRVGQMARAGFLLNIIGIAVLTALTYLVVLPLFVP